MSKNRIWELDALRGLCVIGMVIVHGIFDLVSLFGLLRWEFSGPFRFVMNWGGVLFVLISGISATLGSRCIRRGLTVFGCGMLVTAVTVGMYLLGMANRFVIISFGVLHCLGLCMIGWHFLKKLPDFPLGAAAAVLTAAGVLIQDIRVEIPGLFWLGLITDSYFSADFFPLLPNLGYFLLGALLGRKLYGSRRSLLPDVNTRNPLIRFLSFCGRFALPIYLLHQPVLSLIILAFA